MISSVITYIVSQLNQALKNYYALDEEIVVISNISENSPLVTENRMVAMLVNIERESFPATANSNPYSFADQVGKAFRPINLNLYLMFVANFHGEKYQDGLRFISSTIDFFQHNPAFDSDEHKSMPEGVDKLLLEVENLDLRELHSIWSLITGKYMPSIVFKVRTVSFGAGIQGMVAKAGSLENSAIGD